MKPKNKISNIEISCDEITNKNRIIICKLMFIACQIGYKFRVTDIKYNLFYKEFFIHNKKYNFAIILNRNTTIWSFCSYCYGEFGISINHKDNIKTIEVKIQKRIKEHLLSCKEYLLRKYRLREKHE